MTFSRARARLSSARHDVSGARTYLLKTELGLAQKGTVGDLTGCRQLCEHQPLLASWRGASAFTCLVGLACPLLKASLLHSLWNEVGFPTSLREPLAKGPGSGGAEASHSHFRRQQSHSWAWVLPAQTYSWPKWRAKGTRKGAEPLLAILQPADLSTSTGAWPQGGRGAGLEDNWS